MNTSIPAFAINSVLIASACRLAFRRTQQPLLRDWALGSAAQMLAAVVLFAATMASPVLLATVSFLFMSYGYGIQLRALSAVAQQSVYTWAGYGGLMAAAVAASGLLITGGDARWLLGLHTVTVASALALLAEHARVRACSVDSASRPSRLDRVHNEAAH